MAPLVQNGVVRFTVNGTYAGNEIANIVDISVDTTGTIVGRENAIFEVAGDLINNWSDHVLGFVVAGYSFVSVSWVDLDSPTGSTGVRTSTSATALPTPGRNIGTDMPGNVAYLITKVTPGGGRKTRNGRWYIVGVVEDLTLDTAPNNVNPVEIAGINLALEDLRSGIDDPGPFGIERRFGVVRTELQGVPPEPVAVGFDIVSSLTIASLLATQRRRLRP